MICTGDIMNNNHGYQQPDFANGGDIRGMVRATNDWLKIANDQTKVVVGHGPLGNKKSIADYNAMVKTAASASGSWSKRARPKPRWWLPIR